MCSASTAVGLESSEPFLARLGSEILTESKMAQGHLALNCWPKMAKNEQK